LFRFRRSPRCRICGSNNHGTGFAEAVVQGESRITIVLEVEFRDSKASLEDVEVKIGGKRDRATVRS